MSRLTQEQINRAREIDLLTYMQTYEPQELVHFSGNTYCLREHDSLKISNGKWYWWSQRIGGYNALDFLIKVRDMSFIDAVETLTGRTDVSYTPAPAQSKINEPKELILPEKNDNERRVIAYLCKRGIDSSIVFECIKQGRLYESRKYHNAVFVGTDEYGEVKYASWRGTGDKRVLGECPGSDKAFSFRIEGGSGKSVHCFEAAIDLLSYATLCKMQGRNWCNFSLISMGGIAAPKDKSESMSVPPALKTFLESHPDTAKIYLHFDNDEPGRDAAEALKKLLESEFEVEIRHPNEGKDYNDYLQIYRQNQREMDDERSR